MLGTSVIRAAVLHVPVLFLSDSEDTPGI
jgi:hypothetical protein